MSPVSERTLAILECAKVMATAGATPQQLAQIQALLPNPKP